MQLFVSRAHELQTALPKGGSVQQENQKPNSNSELTTAFITLYLISLCESRCFVLVFRAKPLSKPRARAYPPYRFADDAVLHLPAGFERLVRGEASAACE